MYYDLYNNNFANRTKNPEKLAIVSSKKELSWIDLQKAVEDYKIIFSKLKIPKGYPVIIYGHQEANFLVIMIALISLDIPYVPFDKLNPEFRLKKIKDITGSNVIVKSGEYNFSISFNIVIEADKSYKINDNSLKYKIPNSTKDYIRYIMFTSGSSGEPKCIQISNSSLLSFIDWLKREHPFASNSVFMNQASFSFDLSAYNIFGTLHNGSTIVLIDQYTSNNPTLFYSKLNKYKVDTWISTPSFAYKFITDPNFSSINLESIKTFIFIGEVLTKKMVIKLKEKFKSKEIINSYGPTEATVATSFINCSNNIIKKYNDIPIGVEKINGEILLFDNKNKLSKRGEIIIAGDHVSVGYLNLPEANENSFFNYKGKRAYRTGDLGYYQDGYLFYSGRKDNQIKFNGFRIELDEITKIICKHNLVSSAVTIPFKRNDLVKKIVSFVILDIQYKNHTKNVKKELTNWLLDNVPSYMVPSDIKQIDKFPLNNNNKIDINKIKEMYIKDS